MNVLAIDPGNTESAFVLYSDNKITQKGKIKNIELLNSLMGKLDKVLIEMISSYGMPVGKEVFETVLWIGRYYQKAVSLDIEVELIYRKDIKMHHCNSARAKDGNIIQALKDKYGDKGTKSNPGFFFGFSADVWQAFALAAYYTETRQSKIDQIYRK